MCAVADVMDPDVECTAGQGPAGRVIGCLRSLCVMLSCALPCYAMLSAIVVQHLFQFPVLCHAAGVPAAPAVRRAVISGACPLAFSRAVLCHPLHPHVPPVPMAAAPRPSMRSTPCG